jgi:uncharacterized protein (DUF1330 family)
MTTQRPTVLEVNCETGQETIRPFTDEEMAQHEKDKNAYQAALAEREAAEKAKAEVKANALNKLAALGLTEEEANALIS